MNRIIIRGRTAGTRPAAARPVPLFLSDHEQERYQDEHYQQSRIFLRRRQEKEAVRIPHRDGRACAVRDRCRILHCSRSDSTRAVIFNAKASLANAAPTQFSAAQPEAAAPQQVAAQPANTEPTAAPDAAATRRIPPPALASASPSRDEITAAYQSALKSKVAAVRAGSAGGAVRAPTAFSKAHRSGRACSAAEAGERSAGDRRHHRRSTIARARGGRTGAGGGPDAGGDL